MYILYIIYNIYKILFYIAILLDHEYLDKEYEKTLKGVKEIIEKVLREDLAEGGITVKYFSWTQINFNKGKISNRDNISYILKIIPSAY